MLVNKAQDNLMHFGNNYNLVSEVKGNKILEQMYSYTLKENIYIWRRWVIFQDRNK